MKPLESSEEQKNDELEEAIINEMNLSYFLDSKEYLSVCYENSKFKKVPWWQLKKVHPNDLIHNLIKQLHDENQYVDIQYVLDMLKNGFFEKKVKVEGKWFS